MMHCEPFLARHFDLPSIFFLRQLIRFKFSKKVLAQLILNQLFFWRFPRIAANFYGVMLFLMLFKKI